MITIAVISQKGGAGKTTLAINLAVASELEGTPAVIADLDPQASASAWAEGREGDTPAVIAETADGLTDLLEHARTLGAGIALIDTAPHAKGAASVAARAADLILIPCRPSILDLVAIAASHAIAVDAGKPAAAVLCAVPARGPLTDDAESAIGSYGLAVSPIRIGQRAAFVHAATAAAGVLESAPAGKAADEIRALHAWALACARDPGRIDGG